MLTGWVNKGEGTAAVNEATGYIAKQTFYCDETGARVEGAWVKDTKPGITDDDADEDEYWYYLKKATGEPATGKQSNISGQIYLFNDEGQMHHGWVAEDGSNSTDSNAKKNTSNYYQFDEEGKEMKTAVGNVYYCGDEDDGHAKKNKWLKTWFPQDTNEEEDDQKWFWFDKNGKLFRTSTGSDATKYKLDEGKLVVDGSASGVAKKKVNSKDYWFTSDGVMLSKFYMINDNMYYFGGSDDGAMKTGAQTVKDNAGDSYNFYFYTKDQSSSYESSKHEKLYKGAGVIGNQSNKLYYYGMLTKADDYKYQLAEVNGKTFIVNSNGSIQHSSIEYKEDGDVLIDATNVKSFDKDDAQYKYNFTRSELGKSSVTDIDLNDFVENIK